VSDPIFNQSLTKANATTRAVIAEIQRASKITLAAIAQELEAHGVRTPAGRDRWSPMQVSRRMAASVFHKFGKSFSQNWCGCLGASFSHCITCELLTILVHEREPRSRIC